MENICDSCEATSDKINTKREAFGNRHLTDEENVFQFNAWDNVEWDQELVQQAMNKIRDNSSVLVSQEKRGFFQTLKSILSNLNLNKLK